jgi:hypothetical protein
MDLLRLRKLCFGLALLPDHRTVACETCEQTRFRYGNNSDLLPAIRICLKGPELFGGVYMSRDRLTAWRAGAPDPIRWIVISIHVVQSANGAPYRNRREGHTTGGRRTSPSLTVFLGKPETPLLRRTSRKIDQLISIVCEAEQIADRPSSSLNSRAKISDGSGIRFFIVREKICLDRTIRYHA